LFAGLALRLREVDAHEAAVAATVQKGLIIEVLRTRPHVFEFGRK
jgi:hypothetical protein